MLRSLLWLLTGCIHATENQGRTDVASLHQTNNVCVKA